jgi:hypothetical protein
VTVTGTGTHPDRQASLSDGSTTIEFIFTDGQGGKDENAFRASPYPRTALKTTSGESKYSDLEPPYFAIAQDDFTGGRGNEDFESDTSRYFDGYHLDTTNEDGIVLGGREVYGTGYQNSEQKMPGSVTFKPAYGSTRYLSKFFVASASYTTYQCEIWLRRVGDPGDLQVELWSDSSAEPNAMLASKTIAAADLTTDTISIFKDFVWTGSPGITASTMYHVVIDGGSGANSTNYWEIGCNAALGGQTSSDSSTWSVVTYSPYFRITPSAPTWDYATFFEYKRCLYFFTRDDNTASKLYINGDRGACDSNSGALSTLVDGSKSWTTDEWAGCYVILTDPLGTQEGITWRQISSNTGTALTISPDYEIAHTTSDSYVIVGSNKWTYLRDLDEVRDFTVGNDMVFFTTQDNGGIVRYRAYNSGGTWTEEEINIGNDADYIQYIKPTDDNRANLHCVKTPSQSIFNRQQYYFKTQVPEEEGDYYLEQPVAEPMSHRKYWDGAKAGSGVVDFVPGGEQANFNIAAGHTTGILAAQNFDTPLDLTEGRYISMDLQATTGITANDYVLCISDVEDLQQTRSPVKVFKADYEYNDQPIKVYHLDEEGGSPTYTDLTNTYDGIPENTETVTIETDDRLLIGYSSPFNKVYVHIGATPNAVSNDVTAYYFDGNTQNAVSNISDGTESGGASFAVDGLVSWDMPTGWALQTINGVEAYWISFDWDANLTASVVLRRIVIRMSDAATMDPVYDDMTNAYDGDSATDHQLTLGTEDYLYVGHGTKFNKVSVEIGTANDIASVLTAQYFNGNAWTSVTITDGTDVSGDTLKKTATVGDITFTIPDDWEANTVNSTETYWIRFDVSVALSTLFSIENITVTFDDYYTRNIPALTANTWEHFQLILNRHTKNIDWTSIKSIGIRLDVDRGAHSLYVKNIQTCNNGNELKHLIPTRYPTKGIVNYVGNIDDPVENPWIITESGIFEIQTQNNDQVVPLPLKEIDVFKSEDTGFASTVNGTYLYFNLGKRLQRYFNRTLDDIGPDRDSGLPANRQGYPSMLVSYPGRVFVGIDGQASNYSSVLVLKGTSYHEVYRAPRTGMRIRGAIVHTIPDTDVHHLWLSVGTDIVKVPVNLNPYYESDFTYTHEGYMTTSYIHANLKDVVKLWKSLKIFAENVTATRNIIADYQVDGDTTWTEIGTFDTVPVEEIDIASTLPQAKRIRYRLRFVTDDNSETPRMKAIVTEGVAFVPVKYQYSWTFKLTQDVDNIDNFGELRRVR